MPDATDLTPADPREIAGYRVVRRLGAGGQGVVYLATGPTGQQVAIKQLRFGLQDDRARQQFAKEVSAARRVAPFCTAQVLDTQLDGPAPYVVSEYIDGPSLQQRIDRRGPMTGAELQRLAIGTATALAAIHQAGVVHRDFKPANVMLAYDGPRVIDFGIARDLSTETTVTSRIFGTPAYMAPEQLRAERVGPATDMFAWASVMAYAATGRAPFEAPHMMAVVHRISTGEPDLTGVPSDLLGIVQRCLTKDPAGRPTAQQALAELLGRPTPVQDTADATQVLAEATGLVHAAAASAATTRDAGPAPTNPAAPTVVAPATRAWGEPAAPAAGGRNNRSNRSGRGSLVALAAVLVLLLGGAWALNTGLIDFGRNTPTDNSGGAAPSGVPNGAETEPEPDTETEPETGTEPDTRTTEPTPTDAVTAEPDDEDQYEEGTVPPVFDGRWSGPVTQPGGIVPNWTFEIDLDEGETVGDYRIRGRDLDCSGAATVSSLQGDALFLDAETEEDSSVKCVVRAQMVLTTVAGSDQMGFAWAQSDNPANTASGTLRRS